MKLTKDLPKSDKYKWICQEKIEKKIATIGKFLLHCPVSLIIVTILLNLKTIHANIIIFHY